MRECQNFSPLELQQSGTTVAGSEQFCNGTECGPHVPLAGEIRNGRITLRGQFSGTKEGIPFEGPVVTYDLRYDPGTDRLSGTRNDEPVSAARFEKLPDSECSRIAQ